MTLRRVKFDATIGIIGINPAVDPPGDVLAVIFEQAGRSKGPIPVAGKVNGAGFIQTLVKYAGTWRLYINGPMLKAAGMKVGDVATIELAFDARPREVQTPAALVDAFRKDKAAKAAFDRLTPSRRKEILRYLGSLKSSEVIEKNVKRVIAQLHDEKAGHRPRAK